MATEDYTPQTRYVMSVNFAAVGELSGAGSLTELFPVIGHVDRVYTREFRGGTIETQETDEAWRVLCLGETAGDLTRAACPSAFGFGDSEDSSPEPRGAGLPTRSGSPSALPVLRFLTTPFPLKVPSTTDIFDHGEAFPKPARGPRSPAQLFSTPIFYFSRPGF